MSSSSPTASTPALPGRREEILEKAVHLFAQRGYAAADTQFLADQLQVGKGTIYRYFRSKEELFLAAVDFGMKQLSEAVAAAIDGIADPLDQVRAAIHGFLSFFNQHPEVVELLIQERALFKDRPDSTYYQHRRRNVIRWSEIYRRLIDEHRVREMSSERIAQVVGDLLYGTMFTNHFSGRQQNPELQTVAILDVVWHGILSPTERPLRPVEEPLGKSGVLSAASAVSHSN